MSFWDGVAIGFCAQALLSPWLARLGVKLANSKWINKPKGSQGA